MSLVAITEMLIRSWLLLPQLVARLFCGAAQSCACLQEEAEAETEAGVSGHFDFRIECKLQHGVHAKVWLLVNEIHSQNTLTRRAPGHTYCRTLFHRRRCLGGGGFRREWFVMQELLRYSG